MSDRLDPEQIIRNMLYDFIQFDIEMHDLYIPRQFNDNLNKIVVWSHTDPETVEKIRIEMNRELRKCLHKIDGYPRK